MSGKKRGTYEPSSQPCTAVCHSEVNRGRPCKNLATRGTTVCRMHGANLPNVKNAAARNVGNYVADQKISKYLKTHDVQPVENPLEALKELAGEIVAVKNWLRDQVTELSHDSKVQGQQISAIMQLYSNFIDKADKSLTGIAKLNIDERLSRITQLQAQVMAQVFAEAMLRMSLSPTDQARSRVIIGELLQRYDK